MAEQVYQLTFNGPLYVGALGIDREDTLSYLPSDTLFSALVMAWAKQGQMSLVNQLPDYFNNPAAFPFRLSSAFPYAGPVRFFPRPLRYLPELAQHLDPKRFKQTEWVSEAIFNQLRRGQIPGEDSPIANFIQGKKVWLTRAERAQISQALNIPDAPDDPYMSLHLWGQSVVPRVTVDRRDNASNLFHTGRVVFAQNCGLWFAARGEALEMLAVALDYLSDEGLGGFRAIGHGAFKWQVWNKQTELLLPRQEAYCLNLSRLAPSADEITSNLQRPQASAVAYKLVTVGGWCQDDTAHAWRRKRVRLLAEGAYLGCQPEPLGQLVDVTPVGVGQFKQGRRVYRYGLAFLVSTA